MLGATFTVTFGRYCKRGSWGPFAVIGLLSILNVFGANEISALAPVSMGEIRSMLLVGRKDEEIAREIRSRGVSFEVTRDVLADLKSQGVGRQALEELSDRIGPPVLVVITDPTECELEGNGERLGSTDYGGKRRLTNLKPGALKLTARRRGYLEQTRNVVLERGEVSTVSFKLEVAPARVELMSEVKGAFLVLGEGKRRLLAGESIEVDPGTYEVEAGCPVCFRLSEKIEVLAGEHLRFAPDLALDPVAVERATTEIEAALERGDYDESQNIAVAVLAFDPGHTAALRALAEIAYYKDDRGEFRRAALIAMEKGIGIRLKVKHRDALLSAALADSLLVLTDRSVVFMPSEPACAVGEKFIPLSSISSVAVTDNAGNLWLNVSFLDQKGKDNSLRLADRESVLERAPKKRSLGGVLELKYVGFSMRKRRLAYQALWEIKTLIDEVRVSKQQSNDG